MTIEIHGLNKMLYDELKKENKRLRKQLKTAKIKSIGNKFLDDLTDQECDALAAAYNCERR